MFLLSQATLPHKEIEKVYRDILMIDSRKIMISTAMSESAFAWFRPLFKMTTVKSTQKSNRNKNCSIFKPKVLDKMFILSEVKWQSKII